MKYGVVKFKACNLAEAVCVFSRRAVVLGTLSKFYEFGIKLRLYKKSNKLGDIAFIFLKGSLDLYCFR